MQPLQEQNGSVLRQVCGCYTPGRGGEGDVLCNRVCVVGQTRATVKGLTGSARSRFDGPYVRYECC